jgi:hypothetical protein
MLERALALEGDMAAVHNKSAEAQANNLAASIRANNFSEKYESTITCPRAGRAGKDRGKFSESEYKMLQAGSKSGMPPRQKQTSAGDKADTARAELQALQSQLKTLAAYRLMMLSPATQRPLEYGKSVRCSGRSQSAPPFQLRKIPVSAQERALEYKRQLADLGDKVAVQQN